MKEIFHRTSIRKYKKEPVEKAKIEKMLKAAMAAPSARNQQPWFFYVVTNPTVMDALLTTSPYVAFAKGAAGKGEGIEDALKKIEELEI